MKWTHDWFYGGGFRFRLINSIKYARQRLTKEEEKKDTKIFTRFFVRSFLGMKINHHYCKNDFDFFSFLRLNFDRVKWQEKRTNFLFPHKIYVHMICSFLWNCSISHVCDCKYFTPRNSSFHSFSCSECKLSVAKCKKKKRVFVKVNIIEPSKNVWNVHCGIPKYMCVFMVLSFFFESNKKHRELEEETKLFLVVF